MTVHLVAITRQRHINELLARQKLRGVCTMDDSHASSVQFNAGMDRAVSREGNKMGNLDKINGILHFSTKIWKNKETKADGNWECFLQNTKQLLLLEQKNIFWEICKPNFFFIKSNYTSNDIFLQIFSLILNSFFPTFLRKKKIPQFFKCQK